jgi:hypothetical protein
MFLIIPSFESTTLIIPEAAEITSSVATPVLCIQPGLRAEEPIALPALPSCTP